ncbi:MAG TPA: transcription-repair coupling factor, partial [Acidiferrobacteraceae bacterium]|nr:transcription-repair coupling factor [Acidiferrobacteraceae bacterium]
LVVVTDTRTAQALETEIGFYAPTLCVLPLPDWESLPYDALSPHQDILSQRLRALAQLPHLRSGVVLTTVAALMQRLAPRSHLEAYSFRLTPGAELDLGAFRARLVRSGYQAMGQVALPGEFAVRGGLIDVFPMGAQTPLRIELFDATIDSLRTFDPETQRSLDPVPTVELLPAREYDTTEDAVQRFRAAFRATFEGDPQQQSLYRDVSNGLHPAGIEYYLPLFFERTETIQDYLPADTLCLLEGPFDEAADAFEREVHERHDALGHDRQRPILPPERVFLSAAELRTALAPFRQILLDAPSEHAQQFAVATPPSLPMEPRAERPYHALFQYLETFPGRVLLVAETPGRREALQELLTQNDVTAAACSGWQAFRDGTARISLCSAALDRGLLLQQPALAVITEAQLYGEHVVQRRRRTRTRDPDSIIRSLSELMPGDPVVHEEHGVGRYLGLQRLDVGDGLSEFLALEYAGGDKLYLPVTALHLVHRYTATHPDQAPLHHLGTEAWDKARARAREKARDAAAELLDLYARRASRKGHAFPPRNDQYRRFAATFPFEETPDQARVIDEVLTDMESERPMDRLVCGDVGFGKTEVAMRAAFLAVQAARQVVVLAPTTLLVQQHFENFRDRFADSGARIESLSRFRSPAEQAEVVAGLAAGTVDIVIGTHRLIQPDIRFADLGLVIIDEEHRFGVRQKERLKALRSEVDILTLTATPVPRTLNLALSGLRDISLITTPPQERLAIKTLVTQASDALIREACVRELHRGGQVYFLHNDVKTIVRAEQQLKRLVPEAEIRIAHGQMPERELERVMLDFYHQRFNILVCSTIIETGIDVPSANTIIIERADKFGLAQLHQLRGRVGRSHRRAYAYLLIPPTGAMTADAQKRLDAIGSLEELGIGFTLASHDLEIRGAGELLGEAQSGQIDEVGFSMYSELLERAVHALRTGTPEVVTSDLFADINIHAPALLPDSYVPDPHTRLLLYKRISAAPDEAALRELQVEFIDRFGLLPDAVRRLFRVTVCKLRALPLGIRRIEAGPRGLRLDFGQTPRIDAALLVQVLQSGPGYRMDGPSLRLKAELPQAEDRLAMVERLLAMLAGQQPIPKAAPLPSADRTPAAARPARR